MISFNETFRFKYTDFRIYIIPSRARVALTSSINFEDIETQSGKVEKDDFLQNALPRNVFTVNMFEIEQ